MRIKWQSRQKSTFLARFKIAKQIDHPNIVKVFEVFDEKTKIYIVMELMTGGEVNFW